MIAANVFPTNQWTILVLLVCFVGLRAETETDPSTAELLARIEALEKRGLQAARGPLTTELLARIEELEEQGAFQRHTIERQDEHIAELKLAIKRKNEHDMDQDQRIATLQARVQDQEKTIVTLLNHIKASDVPVTDRAQDENEDDAKERSQVAQTPQGKQNVEGLDRRSRLVMDNGAVAFFVRMTTSLGHIGKHQNVLYDTVLVNTGGGYHADRGVFIVPVSGIYIISTSIASDVKPNNMVEVELEKDGITLAAAFAHSADLTEHDQGSVTVVVPLAANDEVWVRIGWPAADVEVYGSGLSTFTGCLITPTA